jgi:RarD protein
LAFARGLLGGLCLLSFTRFSGRSAKKPIERKKLRILILSGMIMGINWMLLFEAYNYTTVATATLCYYMAPTIVILLSPLLFKEKLGIKNSLCAIIAIVGMALVSGIAESGGIQSTDLKGILFGLGAACFYAGVVILNKLAPVEDAYRKTTIQLFSAAVIMIPYLLLTENFADFHLDGLSVVMLLVVCIVHTGIAYALYFGSMNRLKAQSIAVLSYIDPVSALILSALILHESLTVYGLIGAVLIIGSALGSEIRFKSKA